jgi:hypothetical protein
MLGIPSSEHEIPRSDVFYLYQGFQILHSRHRPNAGEADLVQDNHRGANFFRLLLPASTLLVIAN